MKKMINILYLCTICISLQITGCTADSKESTKTELATITNENYIKLVVAATEGSIRASIDLSGSLCAGGGTEIKTSSDPIYTETTSTSTETTTYTNCNDGEALRNGSFSITRINQLESDDFIWTITYTKFSVIIDGGKYTANGIETCVYEFPDGIALPEVTYPGVCDDSGLTEVDEDVGGGGFSGSGFTGVIDERFYSFEGSVNANENIDGTYDVIATVVDPVYGAISIDADSIGFDSCENGQPNSGMITITGSDSVTTVEFIDCNSFMVTFNGSTTSFNWADI